MENRNIQRIERELLICSDCAIAAANNDYSGIPDELKARVRHGLEAIGGWVIVGHEYGFGHNGCQCCRTGLGGDKFHATVVMA